MSAIPVRRAPAAVRATTRSTCSCWRRKGSPSSPRELCLIRVAPDSGAKVHTVRGDPEIISLLNEQLTSELTAINQYFLHAKMQQNWGLTKLAAYTRSESIDEMKHAEKITDRILFLEGLPNYQRLYQLRIGQTVREQLQADLAIEVEVVERLRPGVTMCRSKGDHTTA